MRCGVIDRATMVRLSRITFNYFLSVKIFLNIATVDFSRFSDMAVPLYCSAVTLVFFIATCLECVNTRGKSRIRKNRRNPDTAMGSGGIAQY